MPGNITLYQVAGHGEYGGQRMPVQQQREWIGTHSFQTMELVQRGEQFNIGLIMNIIHLVKRIPQLLFNQIGKSKLYTWGI